MKNWSYILLAFCCVLIDQLSKQCILTYIPHLDRVTIIPNWFDLAHVYNPGVAFSMFADKPSWFNFIIVTLAILVSAYLIYNILKDKFNRMQKIAAALVIGGALGNVVDRFLHGYVIDFLLFYHNQYSYPVFNLADSFITVGAFFFIIEGYVTQRKAR